MTPITTFSITLVLINSVVACSAASDRRSSARTNTGAETATTAEQSNDARVSPAAADYPHGFNLEDVEMIADYILIEALENADTEVLSLAPAAADDLGSMSFHEALKLENLKKIQKQMSQRLLAAGDKDQSGTLSREEFLALRLGFQPPTGANKQRIDDRRKAAFNKYAGADEVLSVDEILKMTEDFHKLIGPRMRTGHISRSLKQFRSETIAKYDLDKDGKLSAEEAKAMRLARATEQIERHQKLIDELCAKHPALKDTAICK